jgi:type IV pilus assembly protein PilY1
MVVDRAAPTSPTARAAPGGPSKRPPNPRWSDTGRTYTIFSANYLNWFHYHSQTVVGTRLQIMKDVVKSVVDSNTNINIGLVRYDTRIYSTPPSGNKGGPVIFPMSNIDAPDVRDNFKSQVDGLTAGGWTPLSETLYEAYRYLAGLGVEYGRSHHQQCTRMLETEHREPD